MAWTLRPRGRTEVLGFLGQGFSILPVHQKQLEGLFKPRVLGLTPGGVSDSVGLGWSLRICTPNQFPGAAAAAGPGNPTLRTTALDGGVSSIAIFCMNRVGGHHHSSLSSSCKLSGQEGRGPGRWPLTPLLTSPDLCVQGSGGLTLFPVLVHEKEHWAGSQKWGSLGLICCVNCVVLDNTLVGACTSVSSPARQPISPSCSKGVTGQP